MSIKIDNEFKNLIPPLTLEEKKQLEENIVSEGCRDALILWDGTLVDGHNRYEICTRLNIKFEAKEKIFNSRDEVKEWIIRNQFGRRNLSPYQRSELALQLKPLIQAKAKENKVSAVEVARQMNPKNKSEQFSQNSVKTVKPASIDVQRELAKIAGVSHDTIYKVEQIQQKAPEEIRQKVQSGEMSIRQGYMAIKLDKPKAVDESGKTSVKGKEVIIADTKKEAFSTNFIANTGAQENSLPISLRHIQLLVNNFLADADRYLFMPDYTCKLTKEEKKEMLKEIEQIKDWYEKFKIVLS